ncbi:MAG: substrate-binding domain-containing protein [Synechocystis sp.]|nr:substrate-binding domain-containing protein [Synechocystis sp.]
MDSPHLSRRHFLQASAATAIATGLGGCWPNQGASQIQFLNQSLPTQLINRFKRQFPQGSGLQFKAIANLKDSFEQLTTWHNPPPPKNNPISNLPLISPESSDPAQLITIGDRWLGQAIQSQLIKPFDPPRPSLWPTITPRWQLLGQRNEQGLPAPTGQLWGIPYRWGTVMMVYRKSDFKRLGWQPQDWSDLWKPELQQQIALVDDPREVIGLTLKKLGYSYNLTNPQSVPALPDALRELQRQVKFFSTKYYLQALLNKDVWVAVGWSNEIVPLLKTHSELAAVIPPSGTSLWADLWAMPAPTTAIAATYKWLNFSFQPDSLKQMALFSDGFPVPETDPLDQDLLANLPQQSPLRVSPDLLNRCEFLAPLTPASQKQYGDLWLTMRTG